MTRSNGTVLDQVGVEVRIVGGRPVRIGVRARVWTEGLHVTAGHGKSSPVVAKVDIVQHRPESLPGRVHGRAGRRGNAGPRCRELR